MSAVADTMSTPAKAAKAVTAAATPRMKRSRLILRPNGNAMTLADRDFGAMEALTGCLA
jgi:hypothetical protein